MCHLVLESVKLKKLPVCNQHESNVAQTSKEGRVETANVEWFSLGKKKKIVSFPLHEKKKSGGGFFLFYFFIQRP